MRFDDLSHNRIKPAEPYMRLKGNSKRRSRNGNDGEHFGWTRMTLAAVHERAERVRSAERLRPRLDPR
jgi:hypothetical protein